MAAARLETKLEILHRIRRLWRVRLAFKSLTRAAQGGGLLLAYKRSEACFADHVVSQ